MSNYNVPGQDNKSVRPTITAAPENYILRCDFKWLLKQKRETKEALKNLSLDESSEITKLEAQIVRYEQQLLGKKVVDPTPFDDTIQPGVIFKVTFRDKEVLKYMSYAPVGPNAAKAIPIYSLWGAALHGKKAGDTYEFLTNNKVEKGIVVWTESYVILKNFFEYGNDIFDNPAQSQSDKETAPASVPAK